VASSISSLDTRVGIAEGSVTSVASQVSSLMTGNTSFTNLNVTNQIRMTLTDPAAGIAIGGSVIDGLGQGASAVAQGANTMALGNSAQAMANSATALGYNARAMGVGGVAIGANAYAATTGSVAIGYGAVALSSVALGTGAQATGLNTTALGDNAIASGSQAVAVGNNAVATHANSVAIGNGTTTKAANTVAVGTPGNERRITDVAPGVEATDAATVGQLQNTQQQTQQQILGVQREAQRGIAHLATRALVEGRQVTPLQFDAAAAWRVQAPGRHRTALSCREQGRGGEDVAGHRHAARVGARQHQQLEILHRSALLGRCFASPFCGATVPIRKSVRCLKKHETRPIGHSWPCVIVAEMRGISASRTLP